MTASTSRDPTESKEEADNKGEGPSSTIYPSSSFPVPPLPSPLAFTTLPSTNTSRLIRRKFGFSERRRRDEAGEGDHERLSSHSRAYAQARGSSSSGSSGGGFLHTLALSGFLPAAFAPAQDSNAEELQGKGQGLGGRIRSSLLRSKRILLESSKDAEELLTQEELSALKIAEEGKKKLGKGADDSREVEGNGGGEEEEEEEDDALSGQFLISYFVAGGAAGAASRTVVSPLERLKSK